MRLTFRKMTTLAGVLLAGALMTTPVVAQQGASHADNFQDQDEVLAQMTELEQLHQIFHAAVSVHDPVNGDSDAEITQRIREVLTIFSSDARLTTAAGNYVGNGDPNDPLTCPEPSGDTSSTGKQGTLCTFFKYVAGGMKKANWWVSLTPAFKTKYVPVKKDGQWTSSVYYECHYFNVASPGGTAPPWTAMSHVNLSGEAKKIDGRWYFTNMTSTTVGVPIPPAVVIPTH